MSSLIPPNAPHFRFASYNIRKSVGLDWRRNPERILSVINEMKADVVALQEADRRFGSRTSSLPLDLLKKQSGLKAVALSGVPDRLGWHGNAVLVHPEADVLSHETLHLPSLEPRGAVVIEVKLRSARFRVVGLHLALLASIRRRQITALSVHLNRSTANVPTIIMGDFNEWHKAGRNITGFGAHFTISNPGLSFHAKRPIAALDRIITSEGVDVQTMGVHRSLDAKTASDHLPIWADCTFSG